MCHCILRSSHVEPRLNSNRNTLPLPNINMGVVFVLHYLQGEGESQVSLHWPTRWQHNLMGPQNAFGALWKKKLQKCSHHSRRYKTRPHEMLTGDFYWTIYWFFSTYIPKCRNTYLNLDCDDHRNQLFIKLLHHHQLFKSQAAQSGQRHKQTKGEVEVQTALLVCFHMHKQVSHAQQVNLFIKQWDERFIENAAAPPESSKE